MKHLFAPYELAKLAKEKGFNDECLRCYDNGELQDFKHFRAIAWTSGVVQNDNLVDGLVSAPLYQQLIDWFREEHNTKIVENPNGGWDIYQEYDGKYMRGFFLLDETLTEAFKLV